MSVHIVAFRQGPPVVCSNRPSVPRSDPAPTPRLKSPASGEHPPQHRIYGKPRDRWVNPVPPRWQGPSAELEDVNDSHRALDDPWKPDLRQVWRELANDQTSRRLIHERSGLPVHITQLKRTCR